MYIVIVSSWIKKIENVVIELEGVYKIKSKGARLFIYVDWDSDFGAASSRLKKYIRHYLSPIIVFEVYGMFNGKIDILDYLPEDMKMANKYYLSSKDLTLEEEEAFFAEHSNLKK